MQVSACLLKACGHVFSGIIQHDNAAHLCPDTSRTYELKALVRRHDDLQTNQSHMGLHIPRLGVESHSSMVYHKNGFGRPKDVLNALINWLLDHH